MITAHPQAAPAERKEVDFFETAACTRPMSTLWYRSHFPNALHRHRLAGLRNRRMLTGEATPAYLYHPLAPGRVKAALPNVKLVAILRNPVDRAYSNYQMMIRARRESLTFEDAIRHDGTKSASYSYLRRGRYAEHLARWFEHFDRGRFLILTLDELGADRQAVYDRIFDFLGLEPLDVKPQDRGPQDPTVRYGHTDKDGSMDNVGIYPAMNPDTRRMLVGYFRPHNERLRALLKRDFDWDR